VFARPQGVGYRLRKYVARHRWALLTAAMVTIVLGLSIGLVAWQARQALAEAARAQAMQEFMVGLFEQAGGAPGKAMDLRSLLAAAEARDRAEPARQPRTCAWAWAITAKPRNSWGARPRSSTAHATSPTACGSSHWHCVGNCSRCRARRCCAWT
jgi:serine/threonine-protein kinase